MPATLYDRTKNLRSHKALALKNERLREDKLS
jgi:hypothetical protein